MSDIIKRDKDDISEANAMEIEQMKNELIGMDLYDPGISFEQMKAILSFIAESKKLANNERMKTEIHQVCDFPKLPCKITSDEQDTCFHTEHLKPSCSYNSNCTSPMEPIQKQSESSNSTEMFDSQVSVKRNNSLDNDKVSSNQFDNHKVFSYSESVVKSGRKRNSILNLSHIEQSIEEVNQYKKVERWRLNQINGSLIEDDISLKIPERLTEQEHLPVRLCTEVKEFDKRKQLVEELGKHLENMANLWYNRHFTNTTEFQWGSPIQVGIDENMEDNEKGSNNEQLSSEHSDRESHERAYKRKLLTAVSSDNSSASDEDETAHFISVKKKKTLVLCKIANHNYPVKSKRILFENKQEIDKAMISNVIKKKDVSLEENDIRDHLANCSTDDESSVVTDKNIIIKPLPISLSSRIQKQCILLKQASIAEKEKLSLKKIEMEKQKETDRLRKHEIYKKKLHEEQEKKTQQEEMQKEQENKSNQWNEFYRSNLKAKEARKIRLLEEQERRRRLDIEEEEKLLMDDIEIENNLGSNNVTISRSTKVNCPICNQFFEKNQIEDHASQCEQYIIDDNSDNDNHLNDRYKRSSNKIKTEICYICSAKLSLVDYEDHVHQCIERKKDAEASKLEAFHFHENRTSPIRSFKPISKINDSEIDYKNQFATTSKGYKRKLPVFSINIIKINNTWTGFIESQGVSFFAKVPGGIYNDLAKANVIPPNFVGTNDVKNRWVGNQSVHYNTTFIVNKEDLNSSRSILIFYGLDTFTTISLNTNIIGSTSNMFLQYIFDVRKHLREGLNTLEVAFSSAVKEAEKIYNEQSKNYVIPPICVPQEYNGECHVNHIRKMQASFSWDWGPAFPSIGIWKPVDLVFINDIFFMDFTVDMRKKTNAWEINATLFYESVNVESSNAISGKIFCKLYTDRKSYVKNESDFIFQLNIKQSSTILPITIPENLVNLWWPNGYGEQHLYIFEVCMETGDVQCKHKRIGFRTVELIQEPLKKGLSFFFRINNVPIFAKGSNLIPISIFPELSSDKKTISNLFLSVKETHMNMLRIWGGGLYESDLLYDMADEYGIMIWQDFMFACSMYPTTKEFLQSVEEEITQNTYRLKVHPSIVLWAGNNENEAALFGNWYGTGKKEIYRDDYRKLYIHLIKTEIEKLDPTRPFVVSSPSDGLFSEENNYTDADPYLTFYGDVHYYNYFQNGWDINHYPRARFSSEYGFQSLPSIFTLASVMQNIEDSKIGSDFLNHRQHLPLGFFYMNLLLSKNFIMPNSTDELLNLLDYIYLSQINQAISVKVQTEFYRQAKTDLNDIGEGMTMGALYWQLNDVWQAPSWSSIDFNGRWKMLHYYAKEFFAPIIVTSHLDESHKLSVFVVSDQLNQLENVKVTLTIYKWSLMNPLYSKDYSNITMKPNKAQLVDSLFLDNLFNKVGCGNLIKNSQCLVSLLLKNSQNVQIAPINYVYSTPLKNVQFPLANITIRINETPLPGKYSNYPDFEIELETDNIALFVWLEMDDSCCRFSKNGFHMLEKLERVIFHSCEMIKPEELKKKLRVTTLSDIYNPNRHFNRTDLINRLKLS
ncbi:beta-mannosidase [Prorops nasuta]|uniref:beta-mannosidase n=1 Tax=Prorops nasuta TaxID=863751 RepID=UPI0034CDF054